MFDACCNFFFQSVENKTKKMKVQLTLFNISGSNLFFLHSNFIAMIYNNKHHGCYLNEYL